MNPRPHRPWLFLALTILCAHAAPAAASDHRPRLIDLADMDNEPEEEQQILPLLMCSNTVGDLFPIRSMGGKIHFMEGDGTIPWMGFVARGLIQRAGAAEFRALLENPRVVASAAVAPSK